MASLWNKVAGARSPFRRGLGRSWRAVGVGCSRICRFGGRWVSNRGRCSGGDGQMWEFLSLVSIFVMAGWLLLLLWESGGGAVSCWWLPPADFAACTGASGGLQRYVVVVVVEQRPASLSLRCAGPLGPSLSTSRPRQFRLQIQGSRRLCVERRQRSGGAPAGRAEWRSGLVPQGFVCFFMFCWGALYHCLMII